MNATTTHLRAATALAATLLVAAGCGGSSSSNSGTPVAPVNAAVTEGAPHSLTMSAVRSIRSGISRAAFLNKHGAPAESLAANRDKGFDCVRYYAVGYRPNANSWIVCFRSQKLVSIASHVGP